MLWGLPGHVVFPQPLTRAFERDRTRSRVSTDQGCSYARCACARSGRGVTVTYYIDPGTSKGSAVARTQSGSIVGLAIFHGSRASKTWGAFVGALEPAYWEKPQFYPDSATRLKPQALVAQANDLIDLAASGADTARFLAGPCEVIAKRPREWKGQIPKPIHHARLLGRLNAQEYALLVQAYGKDPWSLTAYVKSAAVRYGSTGKLTGYSAEITDLLDACAFALTVEGRL